MQTLREKGGPLPQESNATIPEQDYSNNTTDRVENKNLKIKGYMDFNTINDVSIDTDEQNYYRE